MQNRLHNRVHNHLHNRILFMQQVIETSAAHPFWEGAPESPHLPNIEQSGRHEDGHTHTLLICAIAWLCNKNTFYLFPVIFAKLCQHRLCFIYFTVIFVKCCSNRCCFIYFSCDICDFLLQTNIFYLFFMWYLLYFGCFPELLHCIDCIHPIVRENTPVSQISQENI